MTFANIEYLFLLFLLIPYILWYVLKYKKSEPTLRVPSTQAYMYVPKSYKVFDTFALFAAYFCFDNDYFSFGTPSNK